MGEIQRHAEIFRSTHEQIKSLRPDEDYTFFELGNFFTDISQFRDPFAYMLAKRQIWKKAQQATIIGYIPIIGPLISDIILDAIDIEVWLNKLLGEHEPAEKRYGALSQFFFYIAKGVSHIIFTDKASADAIIKASLPADLQDIDPIEPGELNRAYEKYFTQYYPHEHMDMPQYIVDGYLRSRSRLYMRQGNGLLGYLADQMQYLTEEFSKLELKWKNAKRLSRSDPDRHDVLLEFGKLVHAVEDYFFHSNYIELHVWQTLKSKQSSTMSEEEYTKWFSKKVLDYYPVPPEYVTDSYYENIQWRRKLMRRLRYPVYSTYHTLSPYSSNPSLDTLYTGGFDGKDMFHTMASALENLESLIRSGKSPSVLADKLTNSDLVLIKSLFNAEERTKLAEDGDYLKQQQTTHEQQLKDDLYNKEIDKYYSLGLFSENTRDAFKEAFKIDKELEDINKTPPGVGGFLLAFLSEAQDEINKSHKKTKELNRKNPGKENEGDILNTASENGPSGEYIGTHTLMSKDTKHSQPLYDETRVLAKFASLSISTILINHINTTDDTNVGLDWEKIIRHYLRFPYARQNMWETQALVFYKNNGRMPVFNDIADKPDTSVLLNLFDPSQKLTLLRNGDKKAKLEERYRNDEEKVDRFMMFNLVPG